MSYSKYGYLTNEQINGTNSGSGIINSPLSQKGDIWGYGTADTRLPVDANNKVLTCDSSSAVGVSYKNVDHVNLLNKGAYTHAAIDSHISSSFFVHGVSGRVVGENDTQTLINKTMDFNLNTFSNFPTSIGPTGDTGAAGTNGTIGPTGATGPAPSTASFVDLTSAQLTQKPQSRAHKLVTSL